MDLLFYHYYANVYLMNSLPNSPFQSGEIISSELSTVLYEHAAHPDKLIRQHIEFGLEEANPIEATLNGLRKSIELFNDLESNYGIAHVGFQPVIGELPSGDVAAYIVSDRIDGYGYMPAPDQEKKTYLENLTIKPEHKPAGIALLQSLSDYWTDKVANHKDMLTDIFSIDQYVYEPTSGEFVLVDMDPLFAETSQMKDEVESQWVLTYTGNKLQTLAKALLDSHELEVWQKEMAATAST